jgi:hypothetical protein
MKRLLFILSIYYSCIHVCYGQKASDCIYDSTNITADFIKKISIERFTWDDNRKEARVITKAGDFLYIRKWACITEGIVARLIVIGEYQPIEKNFLKWKEKILSTANEILDSKHYLELKRYLSDETLTAERAGTDLIFNVKSETLKKFVVVLSPVDKMVIISYLIYK